jgi:hypothetical protein
MKDYAVGLGFGFRFDKEVRRVVLTGDTSLFPDAGEDAGNKPLRAVYHEYPDGFRSEDKLELVIAHIGTVSQSDLQQTWGTLGPGKQGFEPPEPRSSGEKEEGWNHLCLRGTFSVLSGLRPKAAIVSEFGEEMKTIWIKAVRTLGSKLNEVFKKPHNIPVFAGDPILVYNIANGQFLCHQDLKFHDPDELRMLGINDPGARTETGHRRPYLFLKERPLDDHSDYEDRVRKFHNALGDRKLPHFSAGGSDEAGRD